MRIELVKDKIENNTKKNKTEGTTLEHTKSILEKLIQKELSDGLPSASLALVKDDQIVWTAAFGYANLGLKAPATPETYYTTASTLKPVTATAILTLVDQGKCKLTDSVNQYLGEHAIDDTPKNSVTIQSLLNHTSGLSDELGQRFVELWDPSQPRLHSLEEVADTVKTLETVGEAWRYNNGAFALAGLLIQNISNISYQDYILKHVLRPLGATTTSPIFPIPAMTEMIAFPYISREDGQPKATSWTLADDYPAGFAFFKAREMACFLGAHLNEGVFNKTQILSKELINKSHQVHLENYGLGWWTRKDETGHTIIQHGGMGIGYATTMIGDKDARVGAYVMTNLSSQACYRIADAAMKLLRGEEYSLKEHPTIELDPLKFKRFEGLYTEEKTGFKIKLARKDGNLIYGYINPPHEGIMVFKPESETRFFCHSFGIELEFKDGDTNEIEGFSMLQHGWFSHGFAKRVKEYPESPIPR